jgi:hypothetical protein
MDVQALTPVLPVEDMARAVTGWAALLGVAPTFVDGDRWAQFDIAGRRLALAGSDRTSDLPGVMIKVADLTAAHAAAIEAGLEAGAIVEGPHELRFVVTTPGGWPATVYAPLR